MGKPVTLLFALAFLATGIAAQETRTMSLEQETRLYEKPDALSAVKATLPAGMRLTILSEQEGWIAVTVSDDVSGWILDPASAESATDVIRSMTDEREAGPPPPPPTAQTPPPPAAGQTPPPPPSRGAAPPPPPPSRTPPPPPPSSRSGSSSDLDSGGDRTGGLYDVHSWTRFHFDTQESVQALGAQYGVMVGRIGEFEANLIGSRTSFSDDDIYGLDLTLRYNLYFLQPSENLPVGVYGSAIGAFQHMFPPEGETTVEIFDRPAGDVFASPVDVPAPLLTSSSPCACNIHENVVRYGGEVGGFFRLDLGSVALIPRVAYQWTNIQPVGDVANNEPFSASSILGGMDFLFGKVAPGFRVTRTEEVNLVSIGLAFPF